MRRCLIVVVTLAAATLLGIPRATAVDAPIGHLGDTLRVDTGQMVADLTVSSVQPVDPPPGFGYNRVGIPVKSFPNSAVEAYRDPVSNVVLLDKTTDYHLAQWNL